MPDPLTAYLFANPADADGFDGPPPTSEQATAAAAKLDDLNEAIGRARAILAAGTVDAVVVGCALDAVRCVGDELAGLAFDLHGIA